MSTVDYPEYRFAQRNGLYRAYKRAEQQLAAPWLNVPRNLTAKEELDTNEFGIPDIPFWERRATELRQD